MAVLVAIGTVVGTILALVVLACWPVMIALGVLHGQWHEVPAFGFWQTVIVLFGVGFVASFIRGHDKAAA